MNINPTVQPKPALPQPLWKKYALTLFGTGATLCWIGYMTLANYLNPIPEKSELLRVPIRVLSVQERDPHLFVELETGKKRTMEFPIAIIAYRPHQFMGMKTATEKKLPGCVGDAWVRPVRYVISDRLQVWALSCGTVNLTYEEAVQGQLESVSNQKEFNFYYLLITLFVMCPFFYLAEKRRK